jgi:hypothetical protein
VSRIAARKPGKLVARCNVIGESSCEYNHRLH